MSEEYGPDFITITDEDGNDFELELLDVLEHNGQTYMAFYPAVDEESDEDGEEFGLVILKSIMENGEELAQKEYELLKRLFLNTDVVLTRDQLLEEIWGYDFVGETRTVDVHVRTLRQKLGEYGDRIETVRGVGYRVSR